MAIALAAICESISTIEVSQVRIKDLDEIPEGILPRDCPVLFPEPINFVTDFTATPHSFQRGSGSKWELHYRLHYKFCYAPVGSDRGLVLYDDMANKAMQIIDAILRVTVDVSGATRVTIGDALNFGPVTDPAGELYLGCEIVLAILDLQELA